MAKGSLGIPDSIIAMLTNADKQRGFPAGTMASILQQETGGNSKYITDPSTYHYAPNAEGKRIAGHTGKISTAFGPFGILESTGADPGYGVQPLQDKSIGEQVRFAADYLQARSKKAGGLSAGLAGYGEGAKYAKQVTSRLADSGGNKLPAPAAQQVQAIAPSNAPVINVAPVQEQVLPTQQAPVAYPPAEQLALADIQQSFPAVVDPWAPMQQAMPTPMQANSMNYGGNGSGAIAPQAAAVQPNFNRFGSFSRMS